MPSKKITLSPRKLPKQERSTYMVDTILQAATRVLSNESLQGFNTNRVAQVAGISVGSLYQYFPNKSALIAALILQEHNRLGLELEACLIKCRGKTLRFTIAAFAKVAVDQQHENPNFAAALDHEEQRLPIKKELQMFQAKIATILMAALAEYRDSFAPDLPIETAQDCLTIAKAMVESETLSNRSERTRLEQRLTRALLGYLCFQQT